MSNNAPPKEIWINQAEIDCVHAMSESDLILDPFGEVSFIKGQYIEEIKYLSEESVREILEALEDTIVQNNKDARFREERLETMLAEKDKEIEMLKKKVVESYWNGVVDGELN